MEMEEKSLYRQGSLCSPDPHHQLLSAFQDRDLPTFQNILNQGTRDSYIDPNYWYDDPHYGTLLDLACRKSNSSAYIKALLTVGAAPDKINKVRKKSPLHLTLETKDLQSFELILNDPRTDPNVLDNKGNTPIHYAAELENLEFLEKLISHPKTNISKANRKGQTALHIAAQQQNSKAALALIQAGIDLDREKNMTNKTGRDIVIENLPDLETELLKVQKSAGNQNPTDLFNFLHRRDTETFISALRIQEKSNLDSNDGSHTYLQYACDFGLESVVGALLREGASPNTTTTTTIRTPLMLAGYRGYSNIVQLLINNRATTYDPVSISSENVLHSVIKGITDNQLALGTNRENRDHLQCLKLLLNDDLQSKLDINCGDIKGNTPLHYAAKHGDVRVILLLLEHGVYIGQKNALGQPAFADVNPKILESYLDKCVTTNKKLPREDNFEIIFKLNFLAPPKTSIKKLSYSQVESGTSDTEQLDESISETEPLLYMTKSSDFRPLLKHPILTSFIHLKWHRIKKYFYYNFTLYLIFWALLTSYILLLTANKEDSQVSGESSQFNNSRVKHATLDDEHQNKLAQPMRFLVAIFLVLLITREVFQLAITPLKYLCNPENWLEIILFGVTIPILLGNKTAQISAIAILLSWAELILLIGRHPLNSTNIEMLKTVSWTFLKFLIWYSILIIAFALSFYILFRDSIMDDGDNFFTDPAMSIFKTVVMLTGEFDAASIPFVAHPGVSHILFVLFVFLIAIVLFNLLNGLAVSDTQAIRADAELVGYVSQVKLISYIETMFMGDPNPFRGLVSKMKELCCIMPNLDCCSTQFGCLRMFNFLKINMFSDLSPDYEIRILPNQENRVEAFGSGHKRKQQELLYEKANCAERCCSVTMDPNIVKTARSILIQREDEEGINRVYSQNHETDRILEEYGKRLDHYRDQLESMRKTSERSQAMIQQLLDLTNKRIQSSSDDSQ